MRYSIEHRNIIYVKGYGFAKNVGTRATKVAKSISIKYSQKLLVSAKNSTTYLIKTASKEQFKKLQKKDNKLLIN